MAAILPESRVAIPGNVAARKTGQAFTRTIRPHMILRMRYTHLLASFVTLMLLALPTLAQDAPEIGKAPEPERAWVGTVIAFVLVVGVAVAGFMTPKRGHQD